MSNLDKKIFSIIEKALEIESGSINIDSSNLNVENWDSLGHFAILSALDNQFDNISEKRPEIAKATSVKKILAILS